MLPPVCSVAPAEYQRVGVVVVGGSSDAPAQTIAVPRGLTVAGEIARLRAA